MGEQGVGRVEKFVRISYQGLNGGLAMMVVINLFSGGVFQFFEMLHHGSWHARRDEFVAHGPMHDVSRSLAEGSGRRRWE
jgi:nitric oxide reductase large subunit